MEHKKVIRMNKMREAMIDQDGAVWEKIGGAWSLYRQAARTVPALHAEQIRVAAVAAIREVTGCPDIKGKDGAYLVDALIVNLLEPKP